MEDQCSPPSWAYYHQEEGIEELKHSLLYTTLELETTILCANEELARKGDEIIHLKSLLAKTIKERDEAQSKCQRLMLDKLIIQQQCQQQLQQIETAAITRTTSNEEEQTRGGDSNIGFSSSGCDENATASPAMEQIPKPQLPPPPPPEVTEKLVSTKPLPEKGKFLQAVMEAGPLLQTLLLAGPLPQWQHPPPQLSSTEIPPVTIASPTPRLLHQDSCVSTSGCFSKKRGLVHCEASDSSPNTKNQKVVHQSSLTNI